MGSKYVRCGKGDVPDGVRFTVLGVDQGQIVEVAYGDFGRSEPWRGNAPFKRVHDQSCGPAAVDYYRRVLDGS